MVKRKSDLDVMCEAIIGSVGQYNKVRKRFIRKKGYDYFRDLQLRAFKKL